MACEKENCVFGDNPGMEMRARIDWRVIREDELITSFVSRPWFRSGHCLVIPNRHVEHVAGLHPEESAAIMGEVGRLALAIDGGYGSGLMHKYQPLQEENGVKVNHLHCHVFPRERDEARLFPVPEPNAFEGFIFPTDEEVLAVAERLR